MLINILKVDRPTSIKSLVKMQDYRIRQQMTKFSEIEQRTIEAIYIELVYLNKSNRSYCCSVRNDFTVALDP